MIIQSYLAQSCIINLQILVYLQGKIQGLPDVGRKKNYLVLLRVRRNAFIFRLWEKIHHKIESNLYAKTYLPNIES